MSDIGRNHEFAAVAEEIAAGRSNRAMARELTEKGLPGSHATIGEMRWGIVPKRHLVDAYATFATPDQQRRLYEAARYAPPEEVAAEPNITGAQRLFDGLHEIQERHPDRVIPVPRMHGGARNLTVEEAESILRDVEDKIRRGVL